jgi:hypothetical protein
MIKQSLVWLEDIPDTGDVLPDLEDLDIPNLEEDVEFQESLFRGSVSEEILRVMDRDDLTLRRMAVKLGAFTEDVLEFLKDDSKLSIATVEEFAFSLGLAKPEQNKESEQ